MRSSILGVIVLMASASCHLLLITVIKTQVEHRSIAVWPLAAAQWMIPSAVVLLLAWNYLFMRNAVQEEKDSLRRNAIVLNACLLLSLFFLVITFLAIWQWMTTVIYI